MPPTRASPTSFSFRTVVKAENVKSHSEEAQRLVLRRARGLPLSLRNKVFLLVNEPSSSLAAGMVGFVTWTHVIAYSITYMAESVEYVNVQTSARNWLLVRLYFNTLFTIEGAARLYAHVPLSGALRDGMWWLDLLSVLPFWARCMASPASVFNTENYLIRHSRPLWVRFFESVGNFRLLKLSRNFSGAELLVSAISRSARELVVPCFMLLIMIMTFSAVMYDIEWNDLCGTRPRTHASAGIEPPHNYPAITPYPAIPLRTAAHRRPSRAAAPPRYAHRRAPPPPPAAARRRRPPPYPLRPLAP